MNEIFFEGLKQKFNSLLNVAKQTLPSLKWHFLIFIFLYLFVIILWKIPQLQVPVSDITNKERFQLENEARKTLAQVLGGTILLVGIYLTWRRIRATERTVEVAQEGQITERFTRAIEQLASDKLEIRLGGIYALERISLDSEKDHWPIMEVLTAFLRSIAVKDKYAISREKHSIFWTPPDIQAILTVLSNRTRSFGKGENRRLNLMRTYLPGAIIGSADLEEVFFVGSDLEEAMFREANLKNANFLFANLKGADLRDSKLEGTIFTGADLHGADLRGAIGLTKEQINLANINESTQLPDYLS